MSYATDESLHSTSDTNNTVRVNDIEFKFLKTLIYKGLFFMLLLRKISNALPGMNHAASFLAHGHHQSPLLCCFSFISSLFFCLSHLYHLPFRGSF